MSAARPSLRRAAMTAAKCTVRGIIVLVGARDGEEENTLDGKPDHLDWPQNAS